MGHVIRTAPASGATLVEVPDEVASELTQLKAHLDANTEEIGYAEFDSVTEKDEFDAQARSWATQNGVKFRQVRAKKGTVPENVLRFRFVALTEEGDAAE